MNTIVSPFTLRAAKEFVQPGRHLILSSAKRVLEEAQSAGEKVLILHRGSSGVLKATAGTINGVRGDVNGLHIKVNLSGPRDLTPRAVESFVDRNLINSGQITVQEYNDLFPCVRTSAPNEITLGYGGHKPVYIRPFTNDELI